MYPKIVVVGAGYWGKNLIRNFKELGHLFAICDDDEGAKELYEAKYPEIQFVTDYKKILSDPQIDGVVLSTPAVTHYSMAKAALQAGEHVWLFVVSCGFDIWYLKSTRN